MTSYYNEIDPFAAAWLRELINAGHIAPGDVDTRSIVDVRPDDLRGYTQCHFFAGIGVWSHALRRAGWADDRPVWTGSCPCQPFSAAGKGLGFADERHLWPFWFHLIRECRPAIVFGEQVASKAVDPWIDLVQADLEAVGYAVGAVPFPSAGVGAPHIRDRTYWLADATSGWQSGGVREWGPTEWPEGSLGGYGPTRELADSQRHGPEAGLPAAPGRHERHAEVIGDGGDRRAGPGAWRSCDAGLEHPASDGRVERRPEPSGRGATGGCSTGRLADDDDDARLEGRRQPGRERAAERAVGPGLLAGGLADAHDAERRPDSAGRHISDGADAGRAEGAGHVEGRDGTGGVADARQQWLWSGQPGSVAGTQGAGESGTRQRERLRPDAEHGSARDVAGPTNGIWRDADWLYCRDGKWRPVEASPQQMVDGSAASLGRVCDADTRAIKEEIDASPMASEIRRPETLRALRETLVAEAKRCWSAGRLPGLYEAPFLLAFLRQLDAQGWSVAQDTTLSREETSRSAVRVLWGDEAAASAPHQRGLDGQQADEHPDAVHLLSSILARHASAAWGVAYSAYAEVGFPLGKNSINRVGRLRGYGNAINAEAAVAFVEAYLDTQRVRLSGVFA